ncbi:glycosyltransferase [Marinobacter salsuginis]|uniref:glycosyltransferase n=1 Tax=Marinobacter salsuginis TaxID=418719 RepID=UPI0010AB34F8|nr:glycosyltransferase [Marinobacter salsuginis]
MSQEFSMNVVFLGTSNSVFVTRTAEELRARGVDVKIIDPYAASARIVGKSRPVKLLRLLRRIWFTRKTIRQLDQGQTVVIHSLGLDLFWIAPLLKRHFKRVVGLAYGSDILLRQKRLDKLLGRGLRHLDCVAATNANVRDAILKDFPFVVGKESRVIRFGLSVFDALEKIGAKSAAEARVKLGYNADKPIICLGYSASIGQRQRDLIAFFAEQAEVVGNYQFVVPVQYGSPEVRRAVERDCQMANLKVGAEIFHPLSEFHGPETSALMRLATTVLINHSVSDAFSGTVQETVYAGNMVLAASHLPYGNMPGFETAIKPYDNLQECVSALHPDFLSHWKATAEAALPKNRYDLRKTSSWDGVIDDWFTLINVNT